MKRLGLALIASFVAGPPIAFGQGTAAQPQLGAPVSRDLLKPLPELKGVVSWQTLGFITVSPTRW